MLGAGFDGVLHFAALSLVGESVEQPKRYYRTNVLGTLTLLEAMRLTGVPRLVFSSTAVYGEPVEVPVTEDAPTRPTNPYGGLQARRRCHDRHLRWGPGPYGDEPPLLQRSRQLRCWAPR